jgi:hypothetical protein
MNRKIGMAGSLINCFSASEGGYWTGVIALEFWCAYFIPVGILSFIHFKNNANEE